VVLRGNVPVLFLLFFALAVLLAGALGRLGGPVLDGGADLPTLALFFLALTGLGLSLLVLARILYLAAWRVRLDAGKSQ
jgi:hypothetical protein